MSVWANDPGGCEAGRALGEMPGVRKAGVGSGAGGGESWDAGSRCCSVAGAGADSFSHTDERAADTRRKRRR